MMLKIRHATVKMPLLHFCWDVLEAKQQLLLDDLKKAHLFLEWNQMAIELICLKTKLKGSGSKTFTFFLVVLS